MRGKCYYTLGCFNFEKLNFMDVVIAVIFMRSVFNFYRDKMPADQVLCAIIRSHITMFAARLALITDMEFSEVAKGKNNFMTVETGRRDFFVEVLGTIDTITARKIV